MRVWRRDPATGLITHTCLPGHYRITGSAERQGQEESVTYRLMPSAVLCFVFLGRMDVVVCWQTTTAARRQFLEQTTLRGKRDNCRVPRTSPSSFPTDLDFHHLVIDDAGLTVVIPQSQSPIGRPSLYAAHVKCITSSMLAMLGPVQHETLSSIILVPCSASHLALNLRLG